MKTLVLIISLALGLFGFEVSSTDLSYNNEKFANTLISVLNDEAYKEKLAYANDLATSFNTMAKVLINDAFIKGKTSIEFSDLSDDAQAKLIDELKALLNQYRNDTGAKTDYVLFVDIAVNDCLRVEETEYTKCIKEQINVYMQSQAYRNHIDGLTAYSIKHVFNELESLLKDLNQEIIRLSNAE